MLSDGSKSQDFTGNKDTEFIVDPEVEMSRQGLDMLLHYTGRSH